MGFSVSELEDLKYRVKRISEFINRRAPNLMSMIHADWNELQEHIKILLEEAGHYENDHNG